MCQGQLATNTLKPVAIDTVITGALTESAERHNDTGGRVVTGVNGYTFIEWFADGMLLLPSPAPPPPPSATATTTAASADAARAVVVLILFLTLPDHPAADLFTLAPDFMDVSDDVGCLWHREVSERAMLRAFKRDMLYRLVCMVQRHHGALDHHSVPPAARAPTPLWEGKYPLSDLRSVRAHP